MLIFKDYVVNQNLGGPLKGLLLLSDVNQTLQCRQYGKPYSCIGGFFWMKKGKLRKLYTCTAY